LLAQYLYEVAMTASPQDDQRYMQLALALGRRGLGNTWPNPAVGVVIVKDGAIAGRGWTMPGGRPHAETEALRRAGLLARGATLYTTLEPCSHHGKTPPCADAIVAAGIARVVSALEDPNPDVAGQGHARMRAHGIDVDVGVCAAEAARAHAGHIRRVREGRPQVMLKLAVSADGKVGLGGRRPVRISGEPARDYGHRLRAMNDAILVGIGTAMSDDPELTCRLSGMHRLSPVRVVLDANLRLPPASKLARSARDVPVWVVASDTASGGEKALRALGVEVIGVPAGKTGIDLAAAMRELARRGITRLMVEGGPTVAGSFLKAGLVDEAVLLTSPKEIGAEGIDAIEGGSLDEIRLSPHFRSLGAEPLGDDTVATFERT
jgi:diaminohydroxyphosphoribosylaminopyrimidine deaminase/5-amino-6-(5-phosphoribosylamino)uracil reductase